MSPHNDPAPPPLSPRQRWLVLAAAFLAWAFAGQAIFLYGTRPANHGLDR